MIVSEVGAFDHETRLVVVKNFDQSLNKMEDKEDGRNIEHVDSEPLTSTHTQ